MFDNVRDITYNDHVFIFICILFSGGFIMKKIAIIMGSDSDWPIVKAAADQLKELDIPHCVRVISAHRSPLAAAEFSKNAREMGYAAIIAAAGKAAHLAGAIAANTTLPVIGIPVKSSTLDGLDALLATVQMPSGMPVATVAIDGAKNAALLASQILSVSEPEIADKLALMRRDMTEKVTLKDQKFQDEFSYKI